MKRKHLKPYGKGAVAFRIFNMVLCLALIAATLPVLVRAEDPENTVPLLTSGQNALDILAGSDSGEYVTLEDYRNPLSDDCEWHNLSSFSGLLYADRSTGAAKTYSTPDYSGLVSDGSCDTVTGAGAKCLQAVNFAPVEGGVKDHVAVVGYFRDSAGYHAEVVVYEPDGDGLKLSSRLKVGGNCSFADNSEHSSFCLTVGKNNQYCDIAAGDFNGDGKDTFAVYVACDGLDYGLYEFSFTPGSGLSQVSSTKKGLHPQYEEKYRSETFDGLENRAMYRLSCSLSAGDVNGDGIDDLAAVSMCELLRNRNPQVTLTGDSLDAYIPYLGVLYGNKGGRLASGSGSGLLLHGEFNSRRYVVQTAPGVTVGYFDNSYETFLNPAVAIGDYDNDGIGEIAVGGIERLVKKGGYDGWISDSGLSHFTGWTDKPCLIACYDGTTGSPVCTAWELAKASSSAFCGIEWVDRGGSEAVSVRWNGAGNPDMLFLDGALYDLSSGTPAFAMNVSGLDLGNKTYDTVGYYTVQTGVFDGDPSQKEALLISYMYATSVDAYTVKQYEQRARICYNNNTSDNIRNLSCASVSIASNSSKYLNFKDGYGSQPLMAAYQPGSSNVVLRFTGDVKRVYSNPTVVAVLEAAPYFADLGVTPGRTTYTLKTTYKYGSSAAYNSSVCVSASKGLHLKYAGNGYSKVSGNVASTMYSSGFTSTLTESVSNYFTALNENSVVVLRIPNYVYMYEVMGSDDTLSVMVPQKPTYTQLTVDAYNSFAKAYNEAYVLTKDQRTAMFDTAVAAYNVDYPEDPIETDTENFAAYRQNFIDMDVARLNPVSIGYDGDLPEDNIGNPWAYTTDSFGFVSENKFSDSSFELSYEGGSNGISASQIREETVTRDVTHSNSVTTSSTIAVSTTKILKGVDFGFTCGFAGGNSTSTSRSTYVSTGSGTEISGSVSNPSLSDIVATTGVNEAVVRGYGFTWNFGYWTFAASDGAEGKVPVLGYKVERTITAPVGVPYSLSVTDKTVNPDSADLTLNWKFDSTHGKAAKYFYISAADYNGNDLSLTLPGGEETEYFGVPCVRVLANSGEDYSVAVTLDRVMKDSTERTGLAEFRIFAASEDNTPPDASGTGMPAYVSTLTVMEGLNGKSAYELAVENGYTGSEAEWLESLKGEAGKSAYDLAKENGYTGTEAEWLEALKGETGKSAYELAKENGYTGTEAEWLESLNGVPGKSAYELAVENGYTGTEAEWLGSLNGVPGKSAYELAKENGYSGTEEEWLESLKGETGDEGSPGLSAYELAVEKGYTGTEEQWLASLEGTPGQSAYELAVEKGYTGTEEQWLASLEGTPGQSAYELAVEKGYTGTEEQWLASLEGTPGQSAYELAVEKGYTGTEEQWLESLKGENGEEGAPGKSAYELAVEKGYKGTEEEWLASLKGEQGDAGLQGLSDYEIAVKYGFTGTEEEWLASLKGEKGEKGETGPQGLQGEKGETGAQGPQGETGVQGPQGIRGQTGARGQQGIQGETGAQGLQGETGAQGPQGVQGETGAQGVQGETGAQGPQGIQGETGDKGLDGKDGKDGKDGTSISAVTVDGDHMLQITLTDGTTINAGSVEDRSLVSRVDALEWIAWVALILAAVGLVFNAVNLGMILKLRRQYA